jgi:hypothetical protein
MYDPNTLRELARRCRERAKSSTDPVTIEQLRCWAAELADAADAVEWNANDPGDPDTARRLFAEKGERT